MEFPPYELTEVGWGEFDIVVTVHFRVRLAGHYPGRAWHRLSCAWLTFCTIRAVLCIRWTSCCVGKEPLAAAWVDFAGMHKTPLLALCAAFCWLAQEDVQEGPLELYHRLKLYDDTGAANPKKPVRDWRPRWRGQRRSASTTRKAQRGWLQTGSASAGVWFQVWAGGDMLVRPSPAAIKKN